MHKIHKKLMKQKGWYTYWHSHEGHQIAHWALVLLIGICFAVLVAAQASSAIFIE